MQIIQSWDTAIKASASNDASVCLTFRQMSQGEGALHHLTDVWSGRVEYPDLKRAIVQQAYKHKPAAILIEDKASGQSLIQDLKREGLLTVIGIIPKGDKVTRFARVTPMIEAGQVALPHYASWLSGFEQEILQFPNGKHDDQVDALSQYLNWVRQKQWDQLRVRSV